MKRPTLNGLQILFMANEHGEVGYAWGNDRQNSEGDLPGLRYAIKKGWIVYSRDATPLGGLRQDIYVLTAEGRRAMQEAPVEVREAMEKIKRDCVR